MMSRKQLCYIVTVLFVIAMYTSWQIISPRYEVTNQIKDVFFYPIKEFGLISNDSLPTSPTARVSPSATTGISITLLVRMAGKLVSQRTRFYCDLFRTAVLYWPPSYGKMVFVLDQESEQDHVFGDAITKQTKQHFPNHKIEVFYESLPRNPRLLEFPGAPKGPGYNRQLWSSFFLDLYTNDTVIAWIDTDVAFVTPVTKSSILNGTRLRVVGSNCPLLTYSWVKTWARTTEAFLGLPFVVDFMIYFPVYIYRDTFARCREYILKRFNTTNFEEPFMKVYKEYISPVSVILSYAWYFERDRYDWNFKLCSELAQHNKIFPDGHKIQPHDVKNILPEPETADHVGHHQAGVPDFLSNMILASYCLTQNAAENKQDIKCANRSFSLDENLVLFNHDLQRVKSLQDTPCVGNHRNSCIETLQRHYEAVGAEVQRGERRMQWKDLETVEMIATQSNISCPVIK